VTTPLVAVAGAVLIAAAAVIDANAPERDAVG